MPSKRPSSVHPIEIRAYFDFMCPWSYLGKKRLERAIQRARVKARIEWVPFELYSHNGHHVVQKELILGHEHLNQTYAQLRELAQEENLIILHPQYEGSTRRALTGFLYAQQKGKAEEYQQLVYEQVFEHTANISSLAVLERIAIKLGWNPRDFISFVETKHHQEQVAKLSAQSRRDGVRGIPSYRINHLPITGALGVNDFVSILHSIQTGLPAYVIPEKRNITIKSKSTKLKNKKIRAKKSKKTRRKR